MSERQGYVPTDLHLCSHVVPDWRDELKIGDVLVTPSGREFQILNTTKRGGTQILRTITLKRRGVSARGKLFSVLGRNILASAKYRLKDGA